MVYRHLLISNLLEWWGKSLIGFYHVHEYSAVHMRAIDFIRMVCAGCANQFHKTVYYFYG
jgi:hypothetical protein